MFLACDPCYFVFFLVATLGIDVNSTQEDVCDALREIGMSEAVCRVFRCEYMWE